jgi:hypothetical protein
MERVIEHVLQDMEQDHSLSALGLFFLGAVFHKNKHYQDGYSDHMK